MPLRPIRAPDLAELETLVVCAGDGSFGAAAERLQISRPAIAKRINNLEALTGKRLLERGGRGVRLTDAGATLLAGARRILDERDVIVSLIAEIRGDGPSPIAGLRELLGHTPGVVRAAQQPEARLAETERVLALVLRSSKTAVAISDPDTSMIHEVNDAFCRITARSRAELIGRPSTDESGAWNDASERGPLIEQLRRTGKLDSAIVHIRRPDGSVRVCETSAYLVTLAGTAQMLSTVDDVTEQHLLEIERGAGIGCYRAVTRVSKLLKSGGGPVESVATVLSDMHQSGRLSSVLLWDVGGRRPHAVAGEAPPRDLADRLEQETPAGDETVMEVGDPSSAGDTPAGWAVLLPSTGLALVLLTRASISTVAQALYEQVLRDLAELVTSHDVGHVAECP